MNVLILKDKDISRTMINPVLNEFQDMFQRNAGILVNFHLEDHDFTSYPLQDYGGGNMGMAHTYLREHAQAVFKRWAEEIDFLVFMPTQAHWTIDDNGKKIWGWNNATIYDGYEIEQVRFDQGNKANTVGTLYHEIMHAMDSFIYRHAGIVIRYLVNVNNWDTNVVHGVGDPWEYIRHKENLDALRAISEPLKKALAVRRSIYDTKVSLMQKIINLAQRVLELQRRLIVERTKQTLPCSHH